MADVLEKFKATITVFVVQKEDDLSLFEEELRKQRFKEMLSFSPYLLLLWIIFRIYDNWEYVKTFF